MYNERITAQFLKAQRAPFSGTGTVFYSIKCSECHSEIQPADIAALIPYIVRQPQIEAQLINLPPIRSQYGVDEICHSQGRQD